MNTVSKLFILAAVVAVSAPSAALAGDVTCVWRGMPQPMRTAAIQHAIASQPLFAPADEAAIVVAAQRCVSVTADKAAQQRATAAAAQALVGYVQQLAGEQRLYGLFKIDSPTLAQAYATIAPASRKELAGGARSDLSQATKNAMLAAANKAVTGRNIQAEPFVKNGMPEFVRYCFGRALRERAETQF